MPYRSIKHAGRVPCFAATLVLAFSLLCISSFLPGPAKADGLVRLAGHVPGTAISTARLIGNLPGQQTVHLSFVLPLRNQDALHQLLTRLYDPKDPLYGHYLTPAQFRDQFGPSPSDVSAVEAYASSLGLTVTGVSGNRTVIDVAGSASRINAAFSLQLRSYVSPSGRSFYAPSMNPAVPAGIAARISGIVGLDNLHQPRPMLMRRTSAATKPMAATANFGHGPSGSGLDPTDIKNVYNLNNLTVDGAAGGAALNGTGQTIGVLEFDGYNASDIQTYEKQYGLPNVPLQNVLVGGASGSPITANGQTEVTLDIELAISQAPDVSTVYVYMAPPSDLGVDIIQKIADDDLAKSISICWGSPEDNPADTPPALYNGEKSALSQMATQGQSVFVAAGDDGAYDDTAEPNTLMVDDPGSQIDDTDVGGTTLTLNANGGYGSETTWNNATGAGGGGISHLWSIPSYQSPVVNASHDSQLSTSMRNVPDVCLDADPDTGYSMYATLKNDAADSGWQMIGGTSCGAPIWAGVAALINQERAANGGSKLGLANNIFYQIAQGAQYNSEFHDIKNGSNNGYYDAETGFDDATGLGSLNGANLLADPLIEGIALDATITGTVTAGNPATGVSGATVSLSLASSGATLDSVQTAGDGSYSIAAPAGDAVDLQATAESYFTSSPVQVTAPASGQTLSGVDITLTQSLHTFQSGVQLVSSPYDYTGDSFASILGSVTVVAAVWDPATSEYVVTPTSPADTFHLGQGYWINPSQTVWLTQAGTTTTESSFPIALQNGWNMIGDPYTSAVPLSDLTVSVSGSTVPYATALSDNTVSEIYYYSGGAYQTLGSSSSLEPWTGYWIESFSPSTLTVPNPG